MNSLFSNAVIEKIKSVKKVFLWLAVCILIGEVVVGAILIIAQTFNETIGKLMGTFALCAVVLFMGVNNFSRMEKGERVVQSFALVSLLANIVWLVLAILFIYEVIPAVEIRGFFNSVLTPMGKAGVVAVDLGVMCFLISNVWAIAETVKPVKPLKITALICELYCGIYAIVMTLGDIKTVDSRWYALTGLAGFAFVVMALAAVIVSRSGAKKNNLPEKEVSDADMQAKVQEMVEKEVQARMAAQQSQTPVADSGQEQSRDGVSVEDRPEENKTADRHFE